MSVNIYDKVTGKIIQIAGNANGVIDDVNVSIKPLIVVRRLKKKSIINTAIHMVANLKLKSI